MRTVFEYLSLLRVPLLFWLVGCLLCWDIRSLRHMSRGVFDVATGNIPIVMTGALIFSAALWLSAATAIEAGPARTGLPPLDGWLAESVHVSVWNWDAVEVRHAWLVLAALALIPTFMCLVRIVRIRDAGWPQRAVAAIATLAVFAPSMFASAPDSSLIRTIESAWLQLIPPDSAGYVGIGGRMDGFHSHAAMLLGTQITQLGVYIVFVLARVVRRQPLPLWLLRWDSFPVLYSVYLMLALVCLLLAGLAFYLDAYGIPLIAAIVVWRLAVGWWDRGSRTLFYKPLLDLPSPREVMAATSAETGGRAIVVCASGGGIHASAWTTRVLTGLEAAHRGGFAAMVRVISAVSGGSVGAMNFASVYGPETGEIPDVLLDYPNQLSRESSLPAALAGWLLFDLPRMFLPWLPAWLTRGWALERRWDLDGYANWPLSAWGIQARLGRRPAVLFNGTAVETGKPVVFGSSRMSARRPEDQERSGGHDGSSSFHAITGMTVDLFVPTAARLSATFPYVTPAARLDPRSGVVPDFAYVDGGYYDNFGVTAAVEFLRQALGGPADAPHRLPDGTAIARLSPPVPIREILIIEIRAAASADVSPGRMWFEQLRAPMQTMLAVRSAAQRRRNDTELRLLQEAMAARGVRITTVVFEYPEAQIPLSWHLTPDDIARIDGAWASGFASEKARVAEFCAEGVRLPLPPVFDAANTPASPA